MPLDWKNSREIAEQLDQVYRDCDLLTLESAAIEEMVLSEGLAVTRPPEAHRENILKSILWHWIRLRSDADDDAMSVNLG